METSKKILALDSSGLVASVAVVEGNSTYSNLLAEYTVNYKKTHSQTLLPMLDEIANMTELDLTTIDAIAIAAGPGSFTGLRIGSATAKGLGLALKKPLISIPTVDALAYNLYGTDRLICPIMDARRNQVYTGIYEFQGNTMEVLEPQMAVDIEVIAAAHVNKQRAGAVGALALRYLEEGKTETAEEHQPEYLRMAQAERERAEKLAKGEGTC